MTQIAVVGASDADENEQATAYAVGGGLARGGVLVVTGGLGGVMAAASRGAMEAGGTTLGLLPGTRAKEGNRWLTVVVPTGLGEARNALVVRAADAIVAVGGGWGTLSELALARRAGLPVVGLRTWDLPGVAIATGPDDAVRQVLAAVGRWPRPPRGGAEGW